MPVDLDSLTPYFSSILDTEEIKIDELYSIFESDFYLKTLEVNGLIVRSKRHWYNPVKDGLPTFYSKYYEKFVHIITREKPGKGGRKSRVFDTDRANRIHWIRPILENHPDARISYFKFSEADGTVRDYFWYKAKDFIVILEELSPDYILITAFCVDSSNRGYYAHKERKSI